MFNFFICTKFLYRIPNFMGIAQDKLSKTRTLFFLPYIIVGSPGLSVIPLPFIIILLLCNPFCPMNGINLAFIFIFFIHSFHKYFWTRLENKRRYNRETKLFGYSRVKFSALLVGWILTHFELSSCLKWSSMNWTWIVKIQKFLGGCSKFKVSSFFHVFFVLLRWITIWKI